MAELCRRADLGEKPLGGEGRRELAFEHFDGDRPVVLEIVGEIHTRHPALADLSLDAIALGEFSGKLAGSRFHGAKVSHIGRCRMTFVSR